MENAENILKDCSCELKVAEEKIIKMCPFCGGKAHLFTAPGKSQVSCIYCHASTAVYKGIIAIDAWNNRA